MNRRQFLLASAVAGGTVLAGCVSEEDDGETGDEEPSGNGSPSETSEDGLSASLRTALGAIPASVDGRQASQVIVVTPEPEMPEESLAAGLTEGLTDEFEVSVAAIDQIATAYFSAVGERAVGVVTGSFAAEDITLEAPENSVIYTEDGFVALAGGNEEAWEAGLDAVRAVRDDPDAGLFGPPAESALRPVVERRYVRWTRDPQSVHDGGVDSAVETIAIGRTANPDETTAVSYAVVFEDERSVAEETLRETLETVSFGEWDDIDPTQDGRVLSGTYTQESSFSGGSSDEGSATDAFFRLVDETTLALRGGDTLDPANLTFLVNGQSREPPWAGRSSPIAPGETFDLDIEPFSAVEIRWQDPEDSDTTRTLLSDAVVSEDAFTGEFDHDTKELTVTYTAAVEVSTDRFEYVQFDATGVEGDPFDDAAPLSELVDGTLEQGSSFTVEMAYGDFFLITVGPSGEEEQPIPVFEFSERPPGEFEFSSGDGTVTVTYRGDPRPADRYRLLVEDEPVSTGFVDEYDQLTDGDSVTVDAEVGDTVTVEWTAGDQPQPVTFHSVSVSATLSFDYDDEARTLEISHTSGPPLDAERLSLEIVASGQQAEFDSSLWTDQYDQFAPGDSVVVDIGEELGIEAELDGGYAVVLFGGAEVDGTALPVSSR